MVARDGRADGWLGEGRFTPRSGPGQDLPGQTAVFGVYLSIIGASLSEAALWQDRPDLSSDQRPGRVPGDRAGTLAACPAT